MLKTGHRFGSQKEHHRNAEVRWIPDVAPFDPQHVFRHDRNRAAQGVRPVRRRTHQNADADAGDVGARRMQPFVIENAAQRQFSRDADDDRQQSLLVAFQNAERQVPSQQNAGDENRRNVTVIEADQLLPRTGAARRRAGAIGAGSSAGSCGLLDLVQLVRRQACRWFAALPDGQRITAFSICGYLPSPKCSRR